MTGYLTRLALRSTSAATGLRPRTPSLFEAAGPMALEHVRPDLADVTNAPLAPIRADEATPPVTALRPDHVEPRHAAAAQLGLARSAPDVAATAPPDTTPVDSTPTPAQPTYPDRTIAASLSPTSVAMPSTRSEPSVTQNVHLVSAAATRPAETDIATADAAAQTSSVTSERTRMPDTRRTTSVRERDADIALPRLHPGPPPPEPAPDVTVSIGRIEVVTPQPPAAPAPPVRPTRATRPSTAPALADYLRDRSRR